MQVEVIKTAIKNTTVKKAARKKRGAGYGDENMEPPCTVTRTSSRRRVISKVITQNLHSAHSECNLWNIKFHGYE